MSVLALGSTLFSLADAYGSNPDNKINMKSLFNEAFNKIKNTGKDVAGAYITGVADSISNTSTGISQGAQGITVKSNLFTWITNNWFVILAFVGILLLLKKRH